MPHDAVIQLDEAGVELLKRHAEWWQGKGSLWAAPLAPMLGKLWLPLADGTIAEEDVDLTPEMVDLDRVIGESTGSGPIELIDEQFSHAAAYSPIPWVEAIFGVPIRTTIQGGSMRARDQIDSWADWRFDAPHFNQQWFDLLMRSVDLLVERRGAKQAITQTLMRGPTDLAEAVLGPELMAFSIYDHPQELRRFLAQATDLFIRVLHAQLERIPAIRGGYVNPFGIWSPGTVVRNQCDATAFLSAAHYEEWFLPHDLRIWQSVDFSIQHLHSNSLHTIDVLLGQELPHAIQVVMDIYPAGPRLPEFIDKLRRILEVKPLILQGWFSEEDVRLIRQELPQDGLSVTVRREIGAKNGSKYLEDVPF